MRNWALQLGLVLVLKGLASGVLCRMVVFSPWLLCRLELPGVCKGRDAFFSVLVMQGNNTLFQYVQML